MSNIKSSSKKPTLQEYIEKHGVIKIAAALGCAKNSVYLWLNLEVQPSFQYAVALIKLSKGNLDFNSIYQPFASPKKTVKK